MTLKVTVSVSPDQSFAVKAQVFDDHTDGSRHMADEKKLKPGQTADFYIHSSRSLDVKEIPLSEA